MEQALTLAGTFRAHVRVQVGAPDDTAELEQALVKTFEAARAPWPGVDLPAEQFVRYLAERLSSSKEDTPLERVLDRIRLSDLYLACACASGLSAAIEAFDKHYLVKLPARLKKQGFSAATMADVCQMVREKALVTKGEGKPHIATYAGEGALQNWTYVLALRFARKVGLPEKDTPIEDVEEILPNPGTDPEMEILKRNVKGQLRPAIRGACSVLSNEERHLLKLYYVRKLSTPKLAALFGLSQPTISRRLESARQSIYHETKRLLQERLRISSRDFESLLAAVESRLDVSLSHIFGKEGD